MQMAGTIIQFVDGAPDGIAFEAVFDLMRAAGCKTHAADVVEQVVAQLLSAPVQIGLFGQAVAGIILKPVLFAVFVGLGGKASVSIVAEAELTAGSIDAGVYQSARVALVVGAVAGRVGIGQ